MTEVVIDPQIAGVEDDGTSGGRVSARLSAGNLVPVAWRTNNVLIQKSGTVNAFINGVNTKNFDGTATGIFCDVPANAALGGGVRISFWFSGPALALRYSRVSGYDLPDISINVDGVNYDVPSAQDFDPISGNALSSAAGEMQCAVISTTLGEGSHFAEVFIQQDKTTARRAYLHGYSASETAGYARPIPGSRIGPALLSVTTSYSNIQSGNSDLAGVRGMFFHNTTAGDVTVSVKRTSTDSNPFYQKTVAAGETELLDMLAPCYEISTMQVTASATGVICTLIGVQ